MISNFQNFLHFVILFGVLSVRLFHFTRLDEMVGVTGHHYIEFIGNANRWVPISGHHHLQHESGTQIGRGQYTAVDHRIFVFEIFVLESDGNEYDRFEIGEMATIP